MRFGYESRKGHNESAHPVHPEAALFVPDCVDEETDEVRAGDVLELVNFKNKRAEAKLAYKIKLTVRSA
jgi:hypothetical protein